MVIGTNCIGMLTKNSFFSALLTKRCLNSALNRVSKIQMRQKDCQMGK
jgi:hypothetical protein